jgi:glutathione S-transferase
MSGSTYKLIYFNVRARAEPIRMIFAVAGVPYEDFRLERSAWPTLKESNLTKNLLFLYFTIGVCIKMPINDLHLIFTLIAYPWGKLPVLEVDGQQLAESSAICRYLARKFNLIGANEFEAARCDELVDAMMDLRTRKRIYLYDQRTGWYSYVTLKL